MSDTLLRWLPEQIIPKEGRLRVACLCAPIGYLLFLFIQSPLPVYGPLIGIAIGFCAVSISIQQIYAAASPGPQIRSRVMYGFSSLTLICLGSGAVTACLPNMPQLALRPDAMRVMYLVSALCYIVGFVALFRFIATYLYRHVSIVFNERAHTLMFARSFTASPPDRHRVAAVLEFIYYVAALSCVIVVIWAYIDDAMDIPVPSVSNIASHTFSALPVYLPFSRDVKKFLFGCLIFSVGCNFWLFKEKLQRVVSANPQITEKPDGAKFTLVMVMLFFIPVAIQVVSLYYWVDQTLQPSRAAILIWTFILFVLNILLLMFHRLLFYPSRAEPSNELMVESKQISVAMSISLGLCAALSVLCWRNIELLSAIPFIFITLGFLTLACARLPILDLGQAIPLGSVQVASIAAATKDIEKTASDLVTSIHALLSTIEGSTPEEGRMQGGSDADTENSNISAT